ncbi:MAG: hypothetical protein JWO56_1956 [Acidobacteria bacterium]|nr:hypothetical protein [Acidobacteriota bacterium]
MRTLSISEVVEIHRRVVVQSGGSLGIRDHAALESSVSQPLQSFGDEELYAGVVRKAAALGFFLASNHPFVDGNKRVAHASVEVTLRLNGHRLESSIDEQEAVMLALASGTLDREQFVAWVEQHVRKS